MKELSIGLEHGPVHHISLCEGDTYFLCIEFQLRDEATIDKYALLNRREAEWFKQLLELHLERGDYDD